MLVASLNNLSLVSASAMGGLASASYDAWSPVIRLKKPLSCWDIPLRLKQSLCWVLATASKWRKFFLVGVGSLLIKSSEDHSPLLRCRLRDQAVVNYIIITCSSNIQTANNTLICANHINLYLCFPMLSLLLLYLKRRKRGKLV